MLIALIVRKQLTKNAMYQVWKQLEIEILNFYSQR